MTQDLSFIKSHYGEIITSEQLYRICHISKRKAKWLLNNKVIPCEDSGKKTRRYKIKTDDVISYMEMCGIQGEIAPVGIFSSKLSRKKKDQFYSLYEYLMEPAHVDQLRKYYEKKFKQFPDGLTTMQIAGMTGFHKNSVNKWIKDGHLKAYQGKTNLIPKSYFLDFLCSDYYLKTHVRSETQTEHMLNFLEQISKE